MSSTKRDVPVENRLLAALPSKEYTRLLPELEHVILGFGKILYEPGERVRHVYFPNDSIISLLSTVSKRSTLEVGIVGNDGMAGISVFMGVDTSRTRALVQGPGTAARMRAEALRKESRQLGMLPRLLDMVGVRREGINKAVGALQRSKLISFSRGSIRILNRRGLEYVSCVCYGIIRDESDSRLTKRTAA